MVKDNEMLKAVLEDERLEDEHREAFEGMQKFLSESAGNKLSTKQKLYVKDIYAKLELDASEGSKNLFSSGKVPKGNDVKLLIDSMPRPLKPPAKRVINE